MNWVSVGLSHKNSPRAPRERLALAPIETLYPRLRQSGCAEGVVLSTCNRFELYMLTQNGAQSVRGALAMLEELAGASLSDYAYTHEGLRTVQHLFEVAS